MKIKMLTRIEGTRNGARWPEAGSIVDLPDGEARDLVGQGIAEPVAAAPEKAAAPAPSNRKAKG